ncbi:MBL fold metallo-hydrolase [Streptomyces sp. NPDC050560]|uniref:MBL fold metallo-hydrolase n=1 Tax=Streptomyces sp. NPDC050560 TaxID=3365630 RepID=UPI00378CF9A7
MSVDDSQDAGLRWEAVTASAARVRLAPWDCGAALVRTPVGPLLVDAGADLRQGAALREAARARAGAPVACVAFTHPHFDHVLGAAALSGARGYGAAGIGSALLAGPGPGGLAALRADALREGAEPGAVARACAALGGPGSPAAAPVEVAGELWLGPPGGGVLLVALGAAHSPCDLAVVVPGAGGEPPVVFCGDLVEESGPPQAGQDAAPGRWPAALDRLLALGGPDARYVPGHGAVVDAAFVRRQRDALARRFRTG